MSQYGQDVWKKLNTTLFTTLESSAAYCRLRGATHIELVHWLYHLHQLADSDWLRILNFYGINTAKVDDDLFQAVSCLPEHGTSNPGWSDAVIHAIERSWFFASVSMQDTRIRSAWLLATLLTTAEFRKALLSASAEFGNIPAGHIERDFPELIGASPESSEFAFDGSGGRSREANTGEAEAGSSLLSKHCMNFSQLAAENKLDPVIGREAEIRAMVDILLRRRQNNPLLVGEAGVGKTAVVEGLALAILNKEVPPALQDCIVLNLDIGSLLAGASMKGEFEGRLKALIKEITDSPTPIILFIDEIHVLIGAGGQAGAGDAANLLKPILARGGLKTIGATTWSEYKKYVETDPALVRRFQVLQVQEPSEAVAIDMLRGLVDVFAEHHQILITDDAIEAAVTLSSRYIPSRQLPDKAISLLDTACSRVSMGLSTPPQKIVSLKQKLAALNKKLAVLQQEASLSGQQHLTTQAQLAADIAQLEAELTLQNADWQKEHALSSQIQRLRQDILTYLKEPQADTTDGDTAAEASTDAALYQELIALEAELQTVQGEAPAVFAQVDGAVVADIVSEWTGVPVGRMLQDEVSAVLKLGETLNERVIGQDQALALMTRRIQTAKAGLLEENKPRGVFLLAGPSGVGKTETAMSLAEALFGGEQNLITINMSEYQEAHTVSSLKGAPPGYVGYGEGGRLTEAVRRKPYSIVLLDEIEKAHKDVHELFYQVFDKGWMEDGEGRYIDFRNTIVIMTSNAGAEEIEQFFADPALVPEYEQMIASLMPTLQKVFPVAFLGRTAIIPYCPLSAENMEKIVRLHLNKVVKRASLSQNIDLTYTEALVQHVVSKCAFHATGVRHVLHYINDNILPTIANMWFSNANRYDYGMFFSLDYAAAEEQIKCVLGSEQCV